MGAPAPVITEVIAPTYAAPTYAAAAPITTMAAPITTMAAPLTTVGAPLIGTTTMAAPFGTVGGYGAPVLETFAPTVGGYEATEVTEVTELVSWRPLHPRSEATELSVTLMVLRQLFSE